MRATQIKSAKSAVTKKGQEIIRMFLDAKCRETRRKRWYFAFQIITAQFRDEDISEQRLFRKIRGRMAREKRRQEARVAQDKRNQAKMVKDAMNKAIEAKVILDYIGTKIEDETGYSMQTLIEEALDKAKEEANE